MTRHRYDGAGPVVRRAGSVAVLLALGRGPEALDCFEAARALEPAHAEYQNNLGVALHTLGRGAEALALFEEALRLRPGYPAALRNREVLLAAAVAPQAQAAIG